MEPITYEDETLEEEQTVLKVLIENNVGQLNNFLGMRNMGNHGILSVWKSGNRVQIVT